MLLIVSTPAAAQTDCQLRWGSTLPMQGYFLDVAPSGDIFVSDAPTQTIKRYTPDGSLILQWGNGADTSWQMIRPFGLTVSDQGLVYVADFVRGTTGR